MIPRIYISRQCKLICRDRKLISGCLGLGGRGMTKEPGKTSWVTDVFTILVVVVGSQVSESGSSNLTL